MAAGFHLIIEPASGGRFEHHLPAGTYTVGQEADACDIAIPSPEISGLHARLTLDRSGFVIEDLGSTLGIFANGQPVSGQQSFIIPCELYLGTMRLQIFAEGADVNDTMPLDTRKVLNAAATPILTHSSIQSLKDHSGTAFGHYTRGKEIARGGMGAILEANDQVLGRTVAMKMVLEDRVNEDLRQRFVREATVLARLEHPNIVPIHEMGKDAAGNLFYTMKKVEGRTLQEILDSLKQGDAGTIERHTLDRLLTIFCKVCDALAFAHSRRVIHRDLKPENIMVGAFGEVLVMDWGLAKVLDDAEQNAAESGRMAEALTGSRHAAADTSPVSGIDELSNSELHDQRTGQLTLDGTIMGSPFYMSPEQADGRIADTDDRSDIYSLGGILYAILTLRPPVTGKKIGEVLTNVRSGNITPPTDFNPGGSSAQTTKESGEPMQQPPDAVRLLHCPGGHIPPALSSVAMKALATEPADRYPEVLSLAADIGAHQGGFATSAENAGALTLVRLFLHRHKIIAAAASLIVLLTVGFMAKVISSEQLAVRNAKSAKAEAARATRAEVVAVEKEAETSKALARSALSLSEAALRESNGPAMRAALDTVPEELRDSTWRYLLSQADTSIAHIDVGASILGVVAHPRLPSVFAIADQTGKVTILNVRTGERLLEFASGLPRRSHSFGIAISPDGERIAVGHKAPAGGIVIHNARDGTKNIAWEAKPSGRLEFSGDSRLLLQHESSTARVNLWDATNGRLRWSHQAEGSVTDASFTPDGKEVSVRGYGPASRLLRVEDGTLVRKFANQIIYTSRIRPDGKAIIGGHRSGTIVGFDMAADREVFRFRTDGQEIRHIVFTVAGTRFVSVAVLSDGRQAIRLWDAETGAPVQSLLGGSGPVNDASVHPLTGELVVCGSETRVWSLGGARWTLRHERPPPLSSIAFWAGDDVVLGPVPNKQTALLRLRGGSVETLWTPLKRDYNLTDVSACGRFAAIGEFQRKEPILLFRRNGGAVEQVGTFTASQHVESIQVSPTGGRLAVMSPAWGFVEVFDATAGGPPVNLGQGEVKRFNDFRWLNEEELLGLVTLKALRGSPEAEEQIVVMDVASGEILRRAPNASTMDVLAVAPDGRRFAEAGADKNVRIRDTATLAVLNEFRVHDDAVTALAWHPKKPILATGSADLTIRLWNLETDERIDEFRGPIAAPHTLAFSPSGQRLGCASQDATTRIWDPPSLRDKTAPPLDAGEGVTDEHVWFAKTPPSAPPSAHVKLKPDADGWTDLLASLTPERVAKAGHGWHLGQGELLSPAARYATVPLPGDLSGTSYQVHVELRRIKAGAVFHIVLPVGDRMTGFELDGSSPGGGIVTSLILVNGKYGTEVPGFVDGRQINDNEPHDLEMTVYPDGANATISVALDARPLYEWTGPASALSQASGWAQVTQPGFLALGTMNNVWAVSAVKVRRLADRTGSDR